MSQFVATQSRRSLVGQVADQFGVFERQVSQLRAENDELRERIRQLEESLIDKAEIPHCFGLTVSQARLLAFLLKRESAYLESIRVALFGASVGEPQSANLVSVMICKIRQKLRPFGVEIKTIWGRGYFLPAESKAKIRAMQQRGNHELDSTTD